MQHVYLWSITHCVGMCPGVCHFLVVGQRSTCFFSLSVGWEGWVHMSVASYSGVYQFVNPNTNAFAYFWLWKEWIQVFIASHSGTICMNSK